MCEGAFVTDGNKSGVVLCVNPITRTAIVETGKGYWTADTRDLSIISYKFVNCGNVG